MSEIQQSQHRSLLQITATLFLRLWSPWSEVKWKSLSHVWLFATHRLYSLWNSADQNTGVGSCSLLQGIFPHIITPRIWECMIEGDSQVSYLLCINGHKGSVTADNTFHPDIFSLQLLLIPSFQIILNYTWMPCFSIQFNPSPFMYITHSQQWDKHLFAESPGTVRYIAWSSFSTAHLFIPLHCWWQHQKSVLPCLSPCILMENSL